MTLCRAQRTNGTGEELVAGLERDHAADKGGDERGKGQGIDPDRPHLLERFREIRPGLGEPAYDVAQVVHARTDARERAKDGRGHPIRDRIPKTAWRQGYAPFARAALARTAGKHARAHVRTRASR